MEKDPGKKKKAKRVFDRDETVTYLRQLADQLENGSIQVSNEEMEFEGQVKVKESMKSKKGKTSVKVEFKLSTYELPGKEEEPAETLEVSQEPGGNGQDAEDKEKPPSYKKLKKRMGRDLKAISETLKDGGEVDPAKLEAFCADCVLMTGFKDKDKGVEHYPEFEVKLQALKDAAQGKDADALKKALKDIAARKDACHKEYK